MKRYVWLVLLASASFVSGQQQGTLGTLYRPGDVTKVVTLQYSDRVNTSILDGIGLVVKRADNLVVITGPQARVDTAVDILHQLDTPAPPRTPLPPPKNIQLTAYLVIASSGAALPQSAPVPKEIEPAVAQVSSMFSYKSFNLLDAIIMRTTDGGGGSVSGQIPGGAYTMNLRRIGISPAEPSGDLFRLAGYKLELRQGNGNDNIVAIGSDVDVKDGQKAVVGKANFDRSSDARALIVILTAKVVE